MAPALDIVIVNWNSRDMLARCLASIASVPDIREVKTRVIVVDNASTDGSLNEGADIEGLDLLEIRNSANMGFAAACNQGAVAGSSDYILFLNPDTELQPGSLTTPVAFMEDEGNDRVAIAGVQLIDESGRVTRSCSRFPTPRLLLNQALGLDRILPGLAPGMMMNEWDHGDTRVVDQVMGAFLMIRRSVFEQLGGFDERFFVYFEDVDLSLRTREAGWSSIYLTSARALHHGCGTTGQVKPRRLFYSLRSRILYTRKQLPPASAWFVLFLTLAIEPFTRLLLGLLHRSREELMATVSGYGMLAAEMPRLLNRGDRYGD